MKIIECPRDAMQGLEKFVDTDVKASYINRLLKVGFDTIDFGSFVSEKAIPQMRDTAKLIDKLDDSSSKLLAIIANKRGAVDACSFERIDYLGFPFSISEEFQKRNTNKSIDESLSLLSEMRELAFKNNKSLVVYLSMAFGNPYNEKWHEDMVAMWAEKVIDLGVSTLALSDTIGVSNPVNISSLFQLLTKEFPQTEWGAHLHTTKDSWREKVESAYNHHRQGVIWLGARRVLHGFRALLNLSGRTFFKKLRFNRGIELHSGGAELIGQKPINGFRVLG